MFKYPRPEFASSSLSASLLHLLSFFRVEWGITIVVVESDALQLVHAIKSTEFDLTPNGGYSSLCFQTFSSFFISHCSRACNKVVDAPALLSVNSLRAGLLGVTVP